MNELTMGQRIAQERKRLGLSQEALGEKTGVSRQAISKWEADGAVPEIDKLIALSRLFGVSVGWLLGVEEPEVSKEDTLTETQLKMVEEIVRRYRPESMEKKFPWIASILLLGAALVIVAVLFGFVFRNSKMDAYKDRIDGLESDYHSIRSHLISIDSRLDDMAVAAETADDLLLSYELNFGGFNTSEKSHAWISVSAIPKQYSNGKTAHLTVLQNGTQVTEAVLAWNGTGYSASALVPVADDYAYCFALRDASGSQQTQILEAPALSDLAAYSALTCGAELFGVNYDPLYGELEIDSFYVWAEKPVFGGDAEQEWTECAAELYRNGELLHCQSYIESLDASGRLDRSLSVDVSQVFFGDVVLKEGDTLELRVRTCCTNGAEVQKTVALWQYSGGQLKAADHIE